LGNGVDKSQQIGQMGKIVILLAQHMFDQASPLHSSRDGIGFLPETYNKEMLIALFL
jgi:hypothetical protein